MPHEGEPQPESERVILKALQERPELFPRPVRKRILFRAQHAANEALMVDMLPVIADAFTGAITQPANEALRSYIANSLENPPEIDPSSLFEGGEFDVENIAQPPDEE